MGTRALVVASCLTLLQCGPRADENVVGGGSITSSSPLLRLNVPVTGGNLALISGGAIAVASNPENGTLSIVDLTNHSVETINLPVDTQPTRMVQDDLGLLRVVLRGTGQLATVSLTSRSLISRDAVCAEPRGITFDPQARELHVACASGELVTVPQRGSVRSKFVAPDLRDVVMVNGAPQVTTFRSAKVLTPATGGVIQLPDQLAPARVAGGPTSKVTPAVAWRTTTLPNGDLVTAHQLEVVEDVAPAGTPDLSSSSGTAPTVPYYFSASRCDTSVVRSAVTIVHNGQTQTFGVPVTLPVDVAVSPDGQRLAVAGAGNATLFQSGLGGAPVSCTAPPATPVVDDKGVPTTPYGVPVGVAFTSNNRLVTLSLHPALITVEEPVDPAKPEGGKKVVQIPLPDELPADPGQQVFHAAPKTVACASCHPEGGDDGHVWKMEGHDRRTMPLQGGLSATAPFHWKGDLSDMNALMKDTFEKKMGGVITDDKPAGQLVAWLDKIPSSRMATVDANLVARGREVFQAAGCAGCHAGPSFTQRANVDVGTGESLQVPSLRGLGVRAPFMHNGCAGTLRERFTNEACGGPNHGSVTGADLDAIVAYMNTL